MMDHSVEEKKPSEGHSSPSSVGDVALGDEVGEGVSLNTSNEEVERIREGGRVKAGIDGEGRVAGEGLEEASGKGLEGVVEGMSI